MVDEETTTWFSPAEDLLPLPEELTPLSQTLITPDLALAFDIHSPTGPRTPPSAPPPPSPFAPSSQHTSADYDSGDICSAAAAAAAATAADEPARTLKRPRLVWTPQLHKRFVEAVAHLGIKNAVPKTIMQLMNVDGLTRENVASHLQKYRLYLKRMQGLPSSAASAASAGGGAGGICHGSVDAATDHLFASSPVPPHFLQANSDHFLPIVSVQQQHYQVDRGRSGYRVNHHNHHHHHHVVGGYSDDLEIEGCSGGGRRVLTLFPSGDD